MKNESDNLNLINCSIHNVRFPLFRKVVFFGSYFLSFSVLADKTWLISYETWMIADEIWMIADVVWLIVDVKVGLLVDIFAVILKRAIFICNLLKGVDSFFGRYSQKL